MSTGEASKKHAQVGKTNRKFHEQKIAFREQNKCKVKSKEKRLATRDIDVVIITCGGWFGFAYIRPAIEAQLCACVWVSHVYTS